MRPDPRIIDLLARYVPASVVVTGADVATALRASGIDAVAEDLRAVPPASAAVVALVAGELSAAGEHAEELLAGAAQALRPGGILVAAARNRVHAAATGAALDGQRAWSADELVRTVGHPGLAVEHVAAPGAAALLAGSPDGPVDDELDRQPGLLDAAVQTLVIARRPGSAAGRTEAFFASVPRKIVAAAVICRDEEDRLLVVHDSFKQHWTIPGGVVDADEDPMSGAVRETYEEAGVRVAAGSLLGVFALSWPDRLLFVYGATPIGDSTPAPLHVHEVDAAAWLPLDEALARINPDTATQVRRCIERPGSTWSGVG